MCWCYWYTAIISLLLEDWGVLEYSFEAKNNKEVKIREKSG